MTTCEDLVTVGKQLVNDKLVSGTSGNLSFRDSVRGIIWVTPTAMSLGNLVRSDMVGIDLDTGQVADGARKPSSETPLHLSIYRQFAAVGAVVHTHSPYATAFAIANSEIPAVHYAIVDLGDRIPVAPYATYGSEQLAQHALEMLQTSQGILLQNHGVVAIGDTLDIAVRRAQTIEQLAQWGLWSTLLGHRGVLSEDQLTRVREQMKNYKQT